MTELSSNWPDDADGGVFQRLHAHGFDFRKPYPVDYMVDFEAWPPAQAAIDSLESMFGSITIYQPDEHGDGYIKFQVTSLVTYEGVTSIQRNVSAAMQPYGGVCESWGVLHAP